MRILKPSTPFKHPNNDGYCYPSHDEWYAFVTHNRGYRKSISGMRDELKLMMVFFGVIAVPAALSVLIHPLLIVPLVIVGVLSLIFFKVKSGVHEYVKFIQLRPCLMCGQSLLEQSADADGYLRCPECTSIRHERAYAIPSTSREYMKFVRLQPCFKCGYSLQGQTANQDGRLQCPECDSFWHEFAYIIPPSGYVATTTSA
ncbi:MAG: hypothetical protein AAF432_02335 [Planctomycetota bacterium]